MKVTVAFTLWFLSTVHACLAQTSEWAIKGGVGGSMIVYHSEGSKSLFAGHAFTGALSFGEASEERFDPIVALTLRTSLGKTGFYTSLEPGFSIFGTRNSIGAPFGSLDKPFTARMFFLTIPAFFGYRFSGFAINPYLSFGAGPHVLLHTERSSGESDNIEAGIDNYRRLTPAAYLDAGVRFGGKRKIEIGLQRLRTVPYGYKTRDTNGFTLHTSAAQLYMRLAIPTVK